jgi:formate hydrogenlyase transcriptional activator
MADGTTATNLEDQASTATSPAQAQHMSSEAALDALQMILLGAPLAQILRGVTRLFEAHNRGMLCAICVLDEDGSHLRYVADNLPAAFRAATDGMCVGPHIGACGAAAYLRKPVFVSDMVSHPNFAPFKEVALQSGLRAAWSAPIMSHDGQVQGTFCMYDSEIRNPAPRDLQLIDYASRVAGIAIERNRSQSALTLTVETITTNEQGLRLIVDSIPAMVTTLNAAGEVELVNRQALEYSGKTTEELKNWATSDLVHPDDLPRMIDAWARARDTGQGPDHEMRSRRADGVYRWVHVRARPQRDVEGRIVRWYNLVTDIDDRKRAEEALRSNEQSLRQIVDSIPGFISTTNAAGEVELQNRQILEYTGKTIEEMKHWETSDILHPDDLPRMIDAWRRAIDTGEPIDVEHRSRGADGVYRWFHARGLPQRDADGRIVRWYNLVTDIDERKRVEGELERAFSELATSEAELRTIIDAIPQLIVALRADGHFLSANQALLEYTGLTKEEVSSERFGNVFHPDDAERLSAIRAAAISRGVPFEYERRVRRKDGQYRWLLVQYNPVRDERGTVIRWYATGTDIDDRKQAEERTRQENVALREQIDRVFMFEEIVGSSPALKTVLSSIVKVAPTDSTVLITGETGTGKELVARAIHEASPRAGHAFISVNCAAIPPALIASELFGHEKGAFTGALQRRQGRFELAHVGTLFLDEVGELPAETQIALLRVIQERQFERVGGNRVIHVDVRIIAATNLDLATAIAARDFRSDLFYRLNVFPIAVPPLRERKEDIPMLVEYFVKRYAEKARKTISKIDKNTLRLFQSYGWPGNIRELQNIIERSVILSTGDTFWIDEGWLSSSTAPHRGSSGRLTQNLRSYEKQLIETALAESNGQVAGSDGAAAKLGIPRSTLDARIKQLKITKYRIG